MAGNFRVLAWASAVLLLAALPSVDPLSAPSPKKVLRVCQSPGCRDDGAASTLECLSAVAPPGVDVVAGGCVSLCGSGPVVEVCDGAEDASSMKKKRVKGSDVIFSLLDECTDEGDDDNEPVLKPYMRDRLMSGYELSLEANDAYQSKDYQSAVELYTDAIESGRKPAMLLQEARGESSLLTDEGYPVGMRWLVASFKNSCRSRLALKDIDGARRDAFASTVFSQNCDGDAHECLAGVCAASEDKLGEMQALKAAIAQYERMEGVFSQPLPGADAPRRAEAVRKKTHAAARRREIGFRVTKLERELRRP